MSTSGMKIYQKLIEVPVADSYLLPKDQLFWPEGRTGSLASRAFQGPQTQNSIGFGLATYTNTYTTNASEKALIG